MMRLNLNQANLKFKLFSLTGLSIFLLLLIVATGFFFYFHIETNNTAIDKANVKINEAYQSIDEATQSIEEADKAKKQINDALKDVMNLRLTEKTYLQFFTITLKDQFETQAERISKKLDVLKTENLIDTFQEYQTFFGQYVDVHAQHNTLKTIMAKPLKESETLLKAIIGEIEEKEQELMMEGDVLGADEGEMMNVARDCQIAFLKLQNIQQKFLATGDITLIEEYKKLVSEEVQVHLFSLAEFSSALSNDNFIKNSKIIKGSINTFLGYIEKSLSFNSQETELIDRLNKAGFNVIKSAEVLLNQADQSVVAAKQIASEERNKAKAAGKSAVAAKKLANDAKHTATIFISIIVLSCILFFIILSLLLSRSIIKPLNRAIEGLNNSADLVAAGSGQVACASQQLSEGATEQAASIEETSASLEEMSSMTKQNADNANQADLLMKEANQVVSTANGSMSSLTVSMKDISKASQDTSNIIKTIDEIAFQTNLLALNAAVEAARAGEAGAGFAVVADEVRNLAMRAADAASNTAELIEETVKKVKAGGDLVATTNEAFAQVATSSAKVGGLVGEISAASKEQAQGISQINSAVTQMDTIVQQNSTAAEESASASEEMNGQAEHMRDFVQDLITLVGSRLKCDAVSSHNPVDSQLNKPINIPGDPNVKKAIVTGPKKIDPELIIPLHEKEDDFKDF